MKKIFLIGIGPGSPEYLTLQAVEIIKRVNTFFILEKESEKNKDLVEARLNILRFCKGNDNFRIINVVIPERKRGGKDIDTYRKNVIQWRNKKAEIIARLINIELKDGESGALLIWGDPSLYDGHIEIINFILKNKMAEFEYEIIPGISSVQLLTARHKIPLNSIADEIRITTGRRLKELSSEDIKNTVVLLDNYLTYKNYVNSDLYIYWGAYLGSNDEVSISGPLRSVIEDILRKRIELKRQKGWIMETYILRQKDET